MRRWVALKRGTWVSYQTWNVYFYTATAHRRYKAKCLLATLSSGKVGLE